MLNTASAQEAAAKLEPLDPILLADATPEQRRSLASVQVPAVFQQYMRQLQLSLSDRLELLARLRDSGAQATAVWMLENAPRFQSAYETRLAQSQSQSQGQSESSQVRMQ
jgi:flagellar biosynthesis chaperone FliJ